MRTVMLATVAAFSIVGVAEADAAKRATNIPAQSLSAALRALAKDRDEDLIFATGDIGTLGTHGAFGELTTDEALDQLLRNSGLVYRRLDEKTISIVPAKATTNEQTQSENTVVVEGTTIEDPILSSRTGDSLRERPQSVTIVTRERLDEQNLNSVASALEQATGITIANVSYTTQSFYSRGFEITSIQLDGGAPFSFNNFGYNQLPDLAIYEQVEVLRGADALFSGNGQPGGTIQLVRKRPTNNPQFEATASVSRYGSYRGQLDASGPLAFDGRLRGRAVYVREELGSFQNIQDSTRDLFYGTLEADLTGSTQLMIGATYDKRIAPHGGFGLPRYADGRDAHLPRSAALSADWARFDTETLDTFARLDQRIGDNWSLRVNFTRTRQEMNNLKQYTYGSIDPTTGLIAAMYGADELFKPVQSLADVTLKGTFDLFGRTHKVAVGADWQDIDSGGNVWRQPSYSNIDPFTFDPRAYPQQARTVIPWQKVQWGQRQNGMYASLSLQITRPLRLIGGARYSNYKYVYGYDVFNTTTGAREDGFGQRYEDNDVLTPYFGFTYEISGGWTGYGSYAESFESQASYMHGPFPGDPLAPKTGESLEFGVKGGLWDGRAATQAAIYLIKRRNEAVMDQGYPPQTTNGVNCCYLAQGVVESRGVDLEINGVLTRGWTLFAGYTYNENEYKGGYDSGLGASFMPQTPRHLFKLWTNYQLPGHLSQWKLGAGLNVQSSNSVRGSVVVYDPITGLAVGEPTPYQFRQGGYALLSARAEYAITPNWSASLNLTNLLDKTYYQTVGDTAWSNWYGQPRSYTLAIRGKF